MMRSTKLSRLIGSRIGKIRYERGETQKQLGEALGKTRTDVNRWESGERGVSAENLKAIAEHYNVSTDYLLGILPEGTTEIKGYKRTAQQYTGLSNTALENIKYIKENSEPEALDTLDAILSNPNLIDVLHRVYEAKLIFNFPRKSIYEKSDIVIQTVKDEEGNPYRLVKMDYRDASQYAKQYAIESFARVIDEVMGKDGKR